MGITYKRRFNHIRSVVFEKVDDPGVLVYFSILTQSIAITYSKFNFCKIFNNNAITFGLLP